MVKLFDSEIEREDWLHQNVHTASTKVATRCMQWIDRILDDLDDGNDSNHDTAEGEIDSDSDDSVDIHDHNPLLFNSPLCRVQSRDVVRGDGSETTGEVEVIDAERIVEDNREDLFVATLEHSLPKIVQEVESVAKGEILPNVILIQTQEVSG